MLGCIAKVGGSNTRTSVLAALSLYTLLRRTCGSWRQRSRCWKERNIPSSRSNHDTIANSHILQCFGSRLRNIDVHSVPLPSARPRPCCYPSASSESSFSLFGPPLHLYHVLVNHLFPSIANLLTHLRGQLHIISYSIYCCFNPLAILAFRFPPFLSSVGYLPPIPV